MEQYIENSGTPNERWHITMWVDMPKYSARGILNFRIKSVVNNLEQTISDPNFPNSTYIFRLDNSLLNKRVFFHFSFSTKDILYVKSFQFGLCDEGVKWVHVDGLAEVKNESYGFFLYKELVEASDRRVEHFLLKEKDSVAKEDSIFLEAITLEVISGELSKVEINLPEKLSNENSEEKEQAKKITAQNFKKKKK